MFTNHTGFESWPLTAAGGGDFPNLTQGSATIFNLNTIPLFQDRMANYVPALVVTIIGTLTQSGGTGVRQPWDALARILIDSLEVKNTWFGSPVSPQNVKGSMLPIIEQLTCGWRTMVRKRNFIPAANGSYAFSYSFPIPLSLGLGDKPHHTAQLAAFYKEAQLNLNIANGSVITALSPGSSLSGLQARCSAVLLPEKELRMGPLVEYIDYQVAATSNQIAVPIQSFGNSTQMTKTEKGAGLFFFGLLTSVFGLPGPFLADAVSRMNVPWRGQTDTGHMVPYMAQALLGMGNHATVGGVVDQGAAQALSDAGQFPYVPGNDPSNSQNEFVNALYFPIVHPAESLETSKVQVMNGDEQINITASGVSGTWHMLAGHLRSWQLAAYNDAASYLNTLGLVDKVLDPGSTGPLAFYAKPIRKNTDVDAQKARFMPQVLKRKNKSGTVGSPGGGRRLKLAA